MSRSKKPSARDYEDRIHDLEKQCDELRERLERLEVRRSSLDVFDLDSALVSDWSGL